MSYNTFIGCISSENTPSLINIKAFNWKSDWNTVFELMIYITYSDYIQTLC